MPSTSLVATWRVNPGRGADFVNNVTEAKKLHLKMGVDAVIALCWGRPAEISPRIGDCRGYSIGATKLFFG